MKEESRVRAAKYEKPNVPSDNVNVKIFNTLGDGIGRLETMSDYHVNILCHGGDASFAIEGREYKIRKDDFVPLASATDFKNLYHSIDFNADVLLISGGFYLENNPQMAFSTRGYIYFKEHPVYHLAGERLRIIKDDYERIRQHLDNEEHLFYREVLGRLVQIFLFDVWFVYASNVDLTDPIDGSNNYPASVFNRFIDLVREDVAENREVSHYAERLCITPKYLSEMVKRASGKSASYWINGYATQLIVMMLRRNDLSLLEISNKLNFYNQSHFSRFVKKMLGMSPSRYRSLLDSQNEE